MPEHQEQYIHFVSSINKLNNAWIILREIKSQITNCENRSNVNSVLLNAAFQFSLVEYSKPYTKSRGRELNAKGKPIDYWLDKKHIPEIYFELHDELLKARNKIHAHDDISVKDAKLHVINIEQSKFVYTVENTIHGAENISKIDAIIDLIEQTLVNMHIEEEQLKSKLLNTD